MLQFPHIGTVRHDERITDLTGAAELACHRTSDSSVDIGAVKDNERSVATKFHRDTFYWTSGLPQQYLPHHNTFIIRQLHPAACRSSICLITTRLSSLDSFTRRPAAAVSASSQHAYHSVVSTSSRLAAFNSNGPTTSTCKCNINKLKNVRNKMCVKTAINAWLKN